VDVVHSSTREKALALNLDRISGPDVLARIRAGEKGWEPFAPAAVADAIAAGERSGIAVSVESGGLRSPETIS
jgi:hypothetical protein